MQQYLITTLEVADLSRSMSVHVDEDKIDTYIRESESIDIKSALGDAFYLDVRNIRRSTGFFLMVERTRTSVERKRYSWVLKRRWHIIPMHGS